MPDEISSFSQLCQQVRFALDEPGNDATETDPSLADYVARVRSNGLQVTNSTVPHVHRAVAMVTETLCVPAHPETYVVNEPLANAYAPAFSGGDRSKAIVVMNSGLVALLNTSELSFAIAHELGHLGLRHAGRLPAEVTRSEFEALQMRSRQRYAEISADRVALVATKSLFCAANVMVKLASGLSTDVLGLDIDVFLRQIDRDPAEVSRSWELEQSHPSLPFRLWALLRFSHSDVYLSLANQGGSGDSLSSIDDAIAGRLAEMGDGRLSEMESQAYQFALVWAGAAMIVDDDLIEHRERVALAQLVGEEHAAKAVGFAKEHGRDAVVKKLSKAVERINAAGVPTRVRFQEAIKSFSMALNLAPEETEAGRLLDQSLRLR